MINPIRKNRRWFLVMMVVFFFAVFATQEVAAAQQRTLAFPAFSLASNPASTNVVRNYEGLRWNNTSGEAALIIPRPPDWNGTSDIRICIFFKPMTNTPGTIHFMFAHACMTRGTPFRKQQEYGNTGEPKK